MTAAELAYSDALAALRAEEEKLAPLMEPVKQGIATCYCWTRQLDAQVDRVQAARAALHLAGRKLAKEREIAQRT